MTKQQTQEFCRTVQDNQFVMYRLAYRILRHQEDAKDAVGEAILRAYEHVEDLQEKDMLKSWILRIVINVSKTMWVKRKRECICADKSYFDRPVEDEYRELWDLLQKLPKNQQDVIHLFFYEEYSIQEISQILGIPEGTVKSRMNRGERRLKKMLETM